MGNAVIFSGTDVKTLKSNIDLGGQAKILSGTVDPTSSATSAPIGSVYLNSSTGALYRKLDAGSSTNWKLITDSAERAVNFLGLNSSWTLVNSNDRDFEVSVGNWAAYADAAATSPVDMTGGTPNTAIARTTTVGEVLNGAGSAEITVTTGATRQGEGVSCLAYVPLGYRTSMLEFSGQFQLTGTVSEDDFIPYVYDVTNGEVITPYVKSKILGSNGRFVAVFAVKTTTAQMRVGIHVARATNTGAVTLIVDDMMVGPATSVVAPAMSESVTETFTPSAGFGTTANQSIQTQRVGDRAYVSGIFQAGTVAASIASLTLPARLRIDSSKISTLANRRRIGHWQISKTGAAAEVNDASYHGPVFWDGTNTDRVYFGHQAGSDAIQQNNGNTLMGSSQYISFSFDIPVVGWSSNVASSNSSTYRISDYAVTAGRVTGAAPTSLGQYRSYLRNASAGTFTETNGTPTATPTSANGFRVYAGNAFSAADTNNEPTAYEIFVGKNKHIQWQFYSSAGRTGHVDTSPTQQTDAVAVGYNKGYDPVTGIAWISPAYGTGSETSHGSGRSGGGSTAIGTVNDPYFDIIVSENALLVQADAVASEIYGVCAGHGSTGTCVRTHTITATRGTAITRTASASNGNNGDKYTINETGVYAISIVDGRSVAGNAYFGISLNSSQPTTAISGITESTVLQMTQPPSSDFGSLSWTGRLNAGDYIYHHTNGSPDRTNYTKFRIVQVSRG
jgi:hypothetical protein